MEGVDEFCPPPSLKYHLCKAATQPGATTGGNSTGGPFGPMNIQDLLVGVIDGLDARRAARETRPQDGSVSNAHLNPDDQPSTSARAKRTHNSTSPSLCSSPPYAIDSESTEGLEGYLKMCGCAPAILLQYKDKFISAGIFDYRLINDIDTPLGEMRKLGFGDNVAKMMYKNTAKYTRKLSRTRGAL